MSETLMRLRKERVKRAVEELSKAQTDVALSEYRPDQKRFQAVNVWFDFIPKGDQKKLHGLLEKTARECSTLSKPICPIFPWAAVAHQAYEFPSHAKAERFVASVCNLSEFDGLLIKFEIVETSTLQLMSDDATRKRKRR